MAQDRHEQALDLTEQSLEALADGNGKAADKLIEQAKKLDPDAPAEVVKDLNEDAISQRAYEIWEKDGRQDGKHDEHWKQAQREIE